MNVIGHIGLKFKNWEKKLLHFFFNRNKASENMDFCAEKPSLMF